MSESIDALRSWWEQQQEALKALAEEAEPTPGAALCGWKRPQASDALAVHPDQLKEAHEDAAAKGVPTDFLPDGRPLLRDRRHRREYHRAYGFYDKDAGYSDAQRGTYRGRRQPTPELGPSDG